MICDTYFKLSQRWDNLALNSDKGEKVETNFFAAGDYTWNMNGVNISGQRKFCYSYNRRAKKRLKYLFRYLFEIVYLSCYEIF